MYFAAQCNHPRLVELLLAHGADINKVQHYVTVADLGFLEGGVLLYFCTQAVQAIDFLTNFLLKHAKVSHSSSFLSSIAREGVPFSLSSVLS